MKATRKQHSHSKSSLHKLMLGPKPVAPQLWAPVAGQAHMARSHPALLLVVTFPAGKDPTEDISPFCWLYQNVLRCGQKRETDNSGLLAVECLCVSSSPCPPPLFGSRVCSFGGCFQPLSCGEFWEWSVTGIRNTFLMALVKLSFFLLVLQARSLSHSHLLKIKPFNSLNLSLHPPLQPGSWGET